MFRFLFIILVILSALEIGVFIWLGNEFGGWFVILGIIGTGIIGALLAKNQGIEALNRAKSQMSLGGFPHDEILDGIAILIGAILLFTPGFITDTLGFLLLIPITRQPVKRKLKNLFINMMNKGNIVFFRGGRR
ncbi:FxsA family protein [Salirhabdus sp. Marseille-P4669]|uniref:FxsA family protein n=1 Tax=Salirhabdus sp. Marseille-P4669 TaxID=2042310 RepID=UPI000C7AC440|nr:FxsA family protein [Salirhabdus sp. Marseille-P4669]